MGLEMWRPISGLPYYVSDLGHVRHAYSGHILRPDPNPKGYAKVDLYMDGRRWKAFIHRLVLAAFLGPCPPGHETNHINGLKDDNRLSNLEWVTSSRNSQHAKEIGLFNQDGSRNFAAKLTEAEAIHIRTLAGRGMRHAEIAGKYGVARRTISDLVARKTWREV